MPFNRLRQLGRALRRRVDRGIGRISTQVDNDVIKLLEALMRATPVDTSEALSNWRVSLNTAPSSAISPNVRGIAGSSKEASIQVGIAKARQILSSRKRRDTIIIFNNAKHLDRLNIDGISPQAEAGFIEKTIALHPIARNIQVRF